MALDLEHLILDCYNWDRTVLEFRVLELYLTLTRYSSRLDYFSFIIVKIKKARTSTKEKAE